MGRNVAQFAPAMLTKKPIVLQTEGLGKKQFHGGITLLVNRHTASVAEMIVAFEHRREDNLEDFFSNFCESWNRLSAGIAHRAYHTWKGTILEGAPVEPGHLIEFYWHNRQFGRDLQLDYAAGRICSAVLADPIESAREEKDSDGAE